MKLKEKVDKSTAMSGDLHIPVFAVDGRTARQDTSKDMEELTHRI